METVIDGIVQGLLASSLLEQTATLLGIVGVWLMIRQNLWAFPVGIVQVTLSAVLFHDYRLYADMMLQGVFVAALIYGWWHWTHGGPEKDARIPVTRLGARGIATAIVAGAAINLGWGWLLATHTDAALPYGDAFIGAFSLVGQWLQARKKLENWLCWLVVDVVAVVIFGMKELYWFAVLYALFCGMAWGGHRAWLQSWREHNGRTEASI